MFSYVTMGLAIVEFVRIVFVILMECFALMLDKFDNKYALLDNFKEQGGFGSFHSAKGKDHFEMVDVDFRLEMANVAIQFVIFPLFNYGINNYWRRQVEREA